MVLVTETRNQREGACHIPPKGELYLKYDNTLHYELQGVNPGKLERLTDESMDWRIKRMKANRLGQIYALAGYERYAERVSLCAMWFKFGRFHGERKLLEAKFCKLRLCPICIARGALVRGKLLSRVMDLVQAEHHCQYIFLTLTIKNVSGDNLGPAIGQLTAGWNRLMQQRPVARAVKGWFRAIEITRHTKNDLLYGTYHPHIHAILAVENGYFKRSNGLFLTHDEWVQRWQRVLRVDYPPTVNIKATYGRSKKGKERKAGEDEASSGAVLEAAKYATKDKDYIDPSLTDEEAVQIVTDYTKALHHRRLTAFGGWLKEVAQRLQADDLDHVDLQPGEDETIREDLAEVIEEYGWHFGAGDYVLARRYVNPLRVKREGV